MNLSAQTQFTRYDDLPGVIKSYKPAFENSFPAWAKMMYRKDINVSELDRQFLIWERQHAGEESAIIRYYKIWRRAVEPYIKDDGSIQPPSLKNYNRNLLLSQKASRSILKTGAIDQSDWTFLGPRETFWLNQSGSEETPPACPWQVNVYSFDVSASNAQILYVGTETGYVNKSIDQGLTWQLVGQEYPFGGAVTAVAIDPTNPEIVYVSAGNQLHKTTDGGITWSPLLEGNGRFAADRLVIDSQNSDRLVAASGSGVYITIDGGSSWQKRWSKASYDVEIKPGDTTVVYALSKNSSGNYDVVISTDSGTTFEVETSFPSTITESSGGLLAITPANPDLLFVLMLSSNNTPYLYKGSYTNTGWNWTLLGTGQSTNFPMNNGQGYFDLVLGVSPVDERLIYAGTTTLFKSADGGAHFTAIGGYSGNFSIHPDIQDIKLLENGDTWISTDGGMTRTLDNFTSTSQYFARVNGLIGSDMWGFDQGWNEDIVVGGRYHNGNTAIADFYQPKALRMGGAESPTGWVIQGKSRHVAFNDLGNGWILPKDAEGEPEGRFIFSKYPNMQEYGGRRSNLVTHPNYFGVMFLGEGNSVWKTQDMGVTWVRIHTFADQVRYLQISFSNPDVLYVDILNRGLYRSADGGNTWIAKTALTRSPFGSSSWKGKLFFVISPYNENRIYACLQNGTWSSDLGKVFVSEDGGDGWQNWSGSLREYLKCMVIQPTEDGHDLVYLFTNSINGRPGKVFFRKTEMDDWNTFSNKYPASMDVNMALPFFRDSKLRVAGNGGVWESPLEIQNFSPIINPWVDRPNFNCMLDTLQFDDHSILNHGGVTWQWSIDPSPMFIDNPNIRNPKVVLGNPGSYAVTLSVNQGGELFTRTIQNMVSATTCPSIGDCTNPAEVPKNIWRLIFADSEERNYPGLATMAFDDDPNTIWHTRWSNGTDGYPHEFWVDMGQRYSVHKFIYLPRQEGVNGRIKEWAFYVGDDYENWGEPIATGEWENSAAPKTIILDETKSGRYWRLSALSEVNGGAWSSAAEFSVVGCNGDTSGEELISLDIPQKIRAYPIPTSGVLQLDLPEATSYCFVVFSSSGAAIDQGTIDSRKQKPSLDMTQYPLGMYVIRLSNLSGNTCWIKVVKE